MFFDGLRKSGVAIGTPVDPRMKTAADLRKNKALPTPRDKGAASAGWQKQFTSQGSRNLKWKRKADKALERRKKYETAKISKLEARIEALKGKVAQRKLKLQKEKAAEKATEKAEPIVTKRTCFRCGDPGHYVANCPKASGD